MTNFYLADKLYFLNKLNMFFISYNSVSMYLAFIDNFNNNNDVWGNSCDEKEVLKMLNF